MKRKISKLFLFAFILLVSMSTWAQKPNIWIHTDMTSATSYNTTSSTSEAVTDQNSDPDDHAALCQYLLIANKFNTVRIVAGITNRNTTLNTGTFVQNTFIDGAYASDYPGMNAKFGGYPTPSSIKVSESSLTAGSGYINFSSTPDTKYDDYNALPATVKLLVDELNKSTYSSTNPLYVLVWGGLQEVAMATKHLIRNNNTAALNRLFVVSHWTMSYINQGSPSDPYDVANCNASSAACDYMHSMAKASGAQFKFVDAASSGQDGIVNGSSTFFNGGITGANATQLKKSKLGALAVKSKFVYGKIDGSDCASFYTVLGTYGVTLNSFAKNGATTQAQEQAAIDAYRSSATTIWNDLLAASNAAISTTSNKQAPTGLSATAANGSVTVRWNAISSSDLSRYAIHRGTSITNIGWIKGSITSNSYTDNTVTNGTKYYYKVEAIYNDGTKLLSSETVSATPGVTNATTRFEAESYSSMSGIKTQSTSDVGGGLNVGYINNNDYCDYTFKVANAGTYTSKFRVASAQNGGKIQILKGTTVLGTVNVATTGGWQTWTTVNGPSINLTSTGTQTIRLKFVNTSTTGFLMNFNWFEITGGGTLKSATMESEELVNQNLSFDLYPNPAHEKITINLNKINESSIVEVFNMQGALVYSQTAEPTLLEIPVTSWKSGVYFVKIKTSQKSLVQKFAVE